MAIFTYISEDQVREFLQTYDIGQLVTLQGIAEGIDNSNYRLQTTQGVFILTLYENRMKYGVRPTIEDVSFFLGLMAHLAGKGLSCPVPVKARDGAALRHLAGRPAAIVTFLPGVSPRAISTAHCVATGAELARLHNAGADFSRRRTNDLSLEGWGRIIAALASRADEIEAGLQEFLHEEYAFLTTHWPQTLPSGVIHADLFPDNAFFQGDRLSGVIDFNFACTDFLVYDLAICLNAWCFAADGAFDRAKAAAMAAGYQSVRGLSLVERQALPVLLRGGALRFLLSRLYDWVHRVEGALVTPHDPREYLAKLRFHQHVVDFSFYGLSQ